MSEPLYEAAKEASGVDPDKIAFKGIVAKSAPKLEEEGYDQDMETAVVEPRTLTAEDRCDRCGAQSYFVVEVGGTELMFCAHHAKQYDEKLSEVGTVVLDERDKLTS